MHDRTFIIIIPGFAKNEMDTTCIPLSQVFIKTLNRVYPHLRVIVISTDFPFHSKPYEWHLNKIIPLNGGRYFFRPLLWWPLYRLLKKIAKENQVHGILNLWCSDHSFVSHHFAKKNKTTVYTWLQGQDAKKGSRLFSFFKPRADQLIALSAFLQKEFHRNYGINAAHIIYPGIDKNMFNPPANGNKEIDILGVGSLTVLKQYHILVEVVARLKKERPGIKAMIIGKGPEKERLEKLISQNALSGNIILHGEEAHHNIPGYMAKAKILIHPSRYEGYGIVCLEALASGCHVVSFVSPEERMIDHWTVVKDFNEMYACAGEILSLPGKEFYPVVPHTIEDTVQQVMQLYS